MVPKPFSPRDAEVNATTSTNPSPGTQIYPQLSEKDAPYRFTESKLRRVIYIPKDFQYGRDGRVPVLLIPGTGSMGGEAFAPNFAKLLRKSDFGDPCWLNIPGRMCDDAAKNAEFVAYAINYLSSLCSRKIAAIGWSQGTISAQWALKHWPSTRSKVRNFICLSGVFGGTVLAKVLVAREGFGYGAAPAIWQQKWGSRFTRMLAQDGGRSAYVPTTSVYSAVDEVVQPQFGKRASALVYDERGVGVLNCEIHKVVGRSLAGLMHTHFSMINPLAWALTEDAIKHGDCGRFERIDMKKVCSHTIPHGLTIRDVAKTNALVAKCARAVLTFEGKCKGEPDLPEYCRKGAEREVLDRDEDMNPSVPQEDYDLQSDSQNNSDALLFNMPNRFVVQDIRSKGWREKLVKNLLATQKEVEAGHSYRRYSVA